MASAATSVVVLSGKGGISKTFCQLMIAAEASRTGIRTLLVDVDPERNLSNRLGVPAHSSGLGSVLEDAGITRNEADPAHGALRVPEEIVEIHWPHVHLLPAGASLQGMSQVSIAELWLLREILEKARVFDDYQLVLFDTGGRVGALVSMAMYAADVAYAPIGPTTDALHKAHEARERVARIQKSHPLRWAGVFLTGFDLRGDIERAIRKKALAEFGDQVCAEVPRRMAVHAAFQTAERLGDHRDVQAQALAGIFRGFLLRDLLRQPDGVPAGVLR